MINPGMLFFCNFHAVILDLQNTYLYEVVLLAYFETTSSEHISCIELIEPRK